MMDMLRSLVIHGGAVKSNVDSTQQKCDSTLNVSFLRYYGVALLTSLNISFGWFLDQQLRRYMRSLMRQAVYGWRLSISVALVIVAGPSLVGGELLILEPLILREMLETLIIHNFGTSSNLVCCVHGSLSYYIPITETGINPARSFGAVVVYNKEKAWEDMGIFWFGPFIGATFAAIYHQFVLKGGAARAYGERYEQLEFHKKVSQHYEMLHHAWKLKLPKNKLFLLHPKLQPKWLAIGEDAQKNLNRHLKKKCSCLVLKKAAEGEQR
ncbi:hypothetical protein C5167_016480 [Papaver somniferum]|nr:hypothetical protein C5167_016480 [Papaver somniferum]